MIDGLRRPRLRLLLFWTGVWLVLNGFCASAFPQTNGADSVQPAEISDTDIARVHELRREIARHDDLYFRLGKPEISDFEYDRLKAELQRLEDLYPDVFDIDPELSIGDDRTGGFPTHRHLVPMLSFEKAFSDEDVADFHRRMSDALGREEIAYWVEPKFDGIAISLTYENGKLIRASTRGNGTEGDDVTANVRTIGEVPSRLNPEVAFPVPEVIEIRGEIFLPFAEFARINREREAAGDVFFANPRNLAAGTIKLHDPREAAERRLAFVGFGWGAFEPATARPETLKTFREMLRAWGVPTVGRAREAIGWKAMREAVNAIENGRNDLPLAIDGAVVKLGSVEDQQVVGMGPEAPKWAVAVKFAPERALTRLLGITLQVGRTGLITPVAELEPVALGGSTIARTTLHNADEIARHDLRIGDFVFVEKAGDVIPAISGVDLSRRSPGNEPFVFPINCPSCGAALERPAGDASHHCVNRSCPAIVVRQLEHFASVVGIRGLGPATVATLVEHLGLKTAADFYRIEREDLLPVPGFGVRSTENLLAAIEESKEPVWEELVFALGIPGVGEQRAEALAKVFPGLAALRKADLERLSSPLAAGGAGWGEETAKAVLGQLKRPEMVDLLRSLEAVGVEPKVRRPQSGPFSGEVVVLTGRLERWTRGEARVHLIRAGARVTNNVSTKTTLLVAGEKPGGKLARAKSLGILVIDEEELAKRLGNTVE